MAWKAIKPGRKDGYWESYKSEIAAYELDKLLGLGMIPPTVEKRVKGELGAAVMWASPTKSFKELGGVPGQKGVQGPPPRGSRHGCGRSQGQDVRQPDWQPRPESRELARRSRVEPDRDRSHARVHPDP